FFFQAEDGIRDKLVTGVQTCALPILDAGPEPDMNVKVEFDGPQLLGTAGALRGALPSLGEAFFVLYGDSYLLCDFGQVQRAFEQSCRLALMTVFANHGCWDRSNVEFVNRQIIAYDKRNSTARMHHIDYGLGVFSRNAIESLPANTPADLSTMYETLLARGELAAY